MGAEISQGYRSFDKDWRWILCSRRKIPALLKNINGNTFSKFECHLISIWSSTKQSSEAITTTFNKTSKETNDPRNLFIHIPPTTKQPISRKTRTKRRMEMKWSHKTSWRTSIRLPSKPIVVFHFPNKRTVALFKFYDSLNVNSNKFFEGVETL